MLSRSSLNNNTLNLVITLLNLSMMHRATTMGNLLLKVRL